MCGEQDWEKLALQLMDDLREWQAIAEAYRLMLEGHIGQSYGYTDEDIEDLRKLPVTYDAKGE